MFVRSHVKLTTIESPAIIDLLSFFPNIHIISFPGYLLACASSLSIRPLEPGKLHKMFTNKCTTANAKKRKQLIAIQ